MENLTFDADVLIIGAGLSGLSAALELQKSGVSFLILEGSDRPGGRVKTDEVNGFLLDRGFQVYLDAYTEGKRLYDYAGLDLKAFDPGAILLLPDGKKDAFRDPIRRPWQAFSILRSRLGTWEDKLNLFSLRTRLCNQKNAFLFEKNEYPTSRVLDRYGFSPLIQTHFLRPFFRGIFLEKPLHTSRRMFDFVFKMFSKGNATLPAYGMEQLVKHMVSRLPDDAILCHKKVTSIQGNTVTTSDGGVYRARRILLATALHPSDSIQSDMALSDSGPWHGCTTVYFSSDTPPFADKLIALNAREDAFCNNLAVLSNISPAYAPPGKSLLSATILGIDPREDASIADTIRVEMKRWFGNHPDNWQLLAVYRIPYALPSQEQVSYQLDPAKARVSDIVFQCGDHLLSGSIQGALRSGRQVAEFIAKDIKKAT